MKKIYVVLSYTGTLLSKVIRLRTHDEFAHISISLDKKLNKMYSFGRLNPYNAFIGGFVQESPKYGTFKRFKKTYVQIYEIEVTKAQIYKMKKKILEIKLNKKDYKFNVLGMFLASLNIDWKQNKSYYCAEFVKYILQEGELDIENLPKVVSPEAFKVLKNANVIYKGYLQDY